MKKKSKNEGIAFIFLDPLETHLQLLYHSQILGGNWSSPTKCMVAVLGSDIQAKPIQIVEKSIKNIKEKSLTIEEFAETLEDINAFMSMKNPKIEFLCKNIIAILNFLIKVFIQLEDTSKFHVAESFLEAILTFDNSPNNLTQDPTILKLQDDEKLDENDEEEDTMKTDMIDSTGTLPDTKNNLPIGQLSTSENLLHVIQFCHLCAKGKIPSALYSLSSNPEIGVNSEQSLTYQGSLNSLVV